MGLGVRLWPMRRIGDSHAWDLLPATIFYCGPGTAQARHARIKWRRSNQIGAEFLTADDLRPIYFT